MNFALFVQVINLEPRAKDRTACYRMLAIPALSQETECFRQPLLLFMRNRVSGLVERVRNSLFRNVFYVVTQICSSYWRKVFTEVITGCHADLCLL